jgi:phospholipid/cholesterol/gamma-HCH transport system permease protein
MKSLPAEAAGLAQPTAHDLVLTGFWTARGIGAIERRLESILLPASTDAIADGAQIVALDTAGAWVLYKLLARLRGGDVAVTVRGLAPRFAKLLDIVAQQIAGDAANPVPAPSPPPTAFERIGKRAAAVLSETVSLLSLIGESAYVLAGCARHPARFRWRTVLYNMRSAGIDALPIVALLSFMLGIVVAYQGADQLRKYGANIFVADLVGLSMLREFAPLITAIIIAGRSGSAYAAQIGTMAVTEELDAMRTLGIAPLEQLVLPKIIALMIALPLLTVAADFFGVFGGMLMAQAQLGVSFGEFLDRFVKAVSVTAYMIGIGKAPVFAAIIAAVGCFQGFGAKGGADSVGRQTTRAVVQSIFLVIVTDALFSIAFSALDL